MALAASRLAGAMASRPSPASLSSTRRDSSRSLSSGLSESELGEILEKADTERVRTARPEDFTPSASGTVTAPESETLDDGDAIELVAGVETPPPQLRSEGLDLGGDTSGGDDRDAYLGEVDGDLTGSDDSDGPTS